MDGCELVHAIRVLHRASGRELRRQVGPKRAPSIVVRPVAQHRPAHFGQAGGKGADHRIVAQALAIAVAAKDLSAEWNRYEVSRRLSGAAALIAEQPYATSSATDARCTV